MTISAAQAMTAAQDEPQTEAAINAEHKTMTRIEALKVEAGLAFQCPVKTREFLNKRAPLILDGDSPLLAAAEDREGFEEAIKILRRTPEFKANRPALARKLGLI